jgi:hypothetical protein
MPSDLLSPDQRVNLEKGFKEILGKQSKTMLNSTLEGKWSLLHTCVSKSNAPN